MAHYSEITETVSLITETIKLLVTLSYRSSWLFFSPISIACWKISSPYRFWMAILASSSFKGDWESLCEVSFYGITIKGGLLSIYIETCFTSNSYLRLLFLYQIALQAILHALLSFQLLNIHHHKFLSVLRNQLVFVVHHVIRLDYRELSLRPNVFHVIHSSDTQLLALESHEHSELILSVDKNENNSCTGC